MLDATCPPDQGRHKILELLCPLLHGQALDVRVELVSHLRIKFGKLDHVTYFRQVV